MASSYGSLDSSSDSEDTEGYASDIDYDMEVEGSSHSSDQEDPDEDEPEEAYADEPLADDEWLTLYAKEMAMERKLEKKLKKRLRGTTEVREW